MSELPSGFIEANKAVYQYSQLFCGLLFGASQIIILQHVNNPKFNVPTMMSDMAWWAFIVAAITIPVVMLRKKRDLENEDVDRVMLVRPPSHICGDFLSASGAVSLFSLVSYVIINDMAVLAPGRRPTAVGLILICNLILLCTGYQLLRKNAKNERANLRQQSTTET
jgi:hypothetical protein